MTGRLHIFRNLLLVVSCAGLVDCAESDAASPIEATADKSAAPAETPTGETPTGDTAADEPSEPGNAAPTDSPALEPQPSAAPALEPQPSAAPALDPERPSYEVPVSAELANYARYAVDDVRWRDRNGERRLEYTLPADLLGNAQRIDFRGSATSDSTWTLRGGNFGEAECAQLENEIVCHEMLEGIAVDVAAIEARVQAGELAPERLDVTRAFESDPIGILRFAAP